MTGARAGHIAGSRAGLPVSLEPFSKMEPPGVHETILSRADQRGPVAGANVPTLPRPKRGMLL